MKLLRTQVIEIDLDSERKRLNECFTGAKLKRHLKILDCFEKGEWEKCNDLYDKLPYDEKEEYSEQENVGSYIKLAFPSYPFYDRYTKTKYGPALISIMRQF